MADLQKVIEDLRKLPSVAKQGLAFERLMVNYIKSDPVLASEYSEVYGWNDWPHKWPGHDVGIDLVAKRVEDGRWTAIQCKFYLASTTLAKSHLDSFFEASGRSFVVDGERQTFANRLIISTTDKWSANAEKMLENQAIPTNRIGLSDIAESPINWDIVFHSSDLSINLTRKELFEARPHQQKAIDAVSKGLKIHDRGKLVMACGTGKTFTSLRFSETFAEENGGAAKILFLVPSIALLGQTLREWTAQARLTLRSMAVCSDQKVGGDAEDIAKHDLFIPVSTDGAEIAENFAKKRRVKGLQVIFSTYQSIQAIHEAQQAGLEDFDLIICDEAHRTTGAKLFAGDTSNFNLVHDAEYLRAKKRLYMTATPKIFGEDVKRKAVTVSAELFSMDDEAVYGPEFHRLGFGETVEAGLLTDYKVLVMAVDEGVAASAMTRLAANEGQELTLSNAAAMIGAWNALAKRSGAEQGTESGFEIGAKHMLRTVAFAKDINTSKQIVDSYPAVIAQYQKMLLQHAENKNAVSLHNVNVAVEAQHVDGSMNSLQRGEKLTWLKGDFQNKSTRILSNARCLSEGVDVPALDAVIFFNPRNSMVDVVQSVGRVMRKAPGKDYGYIILPVATPANKDPNQVLDDSTRFKVVWQILNALRAHDERFNAIVNAAQLNRAKETELPVIADYITNPKANLEFTEGQADIDTNDFDAANAPTQKSSKDAKSADEASDFQAQGVLFNLEQWQEAIYAKLVQKVGTRTYWEDWAKDVASIAEAQVTRINKIIDAASPSLRREFDRFVDGLKANLNDSIDEAKAVSMLSQHLITAPVFNALFSEYDFAKHNPVSQVMQRMVDALSSHNLDSETEKLDAFYKSVERRAAAVTSASGKQQIVKELYEKFFKAAFKKESEALGIVYTPIEIVDYILRVADQVLEKHFGRRLTDEGVHILDPFTGTGTFPVRLLEMGLIRPDDLARKYAKELHATEIMLLAYYVAAVNIEVTYNALKLEEAKRNGEPEPEYVPFQGIALADTFQIHEDDDELDLEIFTENSDRIERQKASPIQVIVGNPPYSAGQTSANDLNANLKYPSLDRRIETTYAKLSTAANKNSLYDSYLRAFRWATDRIGEQGVVAFVSNGGWLDGNTGDGVRLSLQQDFTDVYVFNLRGNARTAGETRRKESGNVFSDNVRTTIAITIAVKDPNKQGFNLHYRDIGDYLSAEEKLEIVNSSDLDTTNWVELNPNQHGDWISQRNEEFSTWPVLGDKKDASKLRYFVNYSRGLATGRDPWCYNFSTNALLKNLHCMVDTFNSAKAEFAGWQTISGVSNPQEADVTAFLKQKPHLANPSKISWNRTLKKDVAKKREIAVNEKRNYISMYRPFVKMQSMFDAPLNDMTYRLPSIFPTPNHPNVGFSVSGPSSPSPFGVIAMCTLPDVQTLGNGQFFPRFTWQKVDAELIDLFSGGFGSTEEVSSKYGSIGETVDGYKRVDNITPEILDQFKTKFGASVSSDDIFHFVYGKLHDETYRSEFAADLKKMLPHIPLPISVEEFQKFVDAGEKLLNLHINYESVEPYPLEIKINGDADDPETYRVTKMKWAKKKDPQTGKSIDDKSTLIYNSKITISGIPEEAEEYKLGSRSAIGWLIDRYQVKTDKASEITNDPNDWCHEIGDPKYILDIILKVTAVSVETMKIVSDLNE